MGLNDTPSSERIQIGIFGRRNAGKSTLFNLLVGEDLAVVSDTLGTTTDPVKKAMELLPLGPVVFIDTPGLDDEGELGEKRITKAKQILRKIDMVVLVTSAEGPDAFETDFLEEIKKRKLSYVTVTARENWEREGILNEIINAYELPKERPLVRDFIAPNDRVVLVIPIDKAAPKGRLILPQQQVIRDILDAGGIPVICRETELSEVLKDDVHPPKMVICDSQVFEMVNKEVPKEIPLTSFSILMARYKGDLETQIEGAKALGTLKEGARILISEGCSHKRQCKDIGTVKIPGWIKNYTGKEFSFEFTSGGEYPEELSGYDLIIHCGGCMLPLREMEYRIESAKQQNIPITNYGVLIAYMHGILDRASEVFQRGNK